MSCASISLAWLAYLKGPPARLSLASLAMLTRLSLA